MKKKIVARRRANKNYSRTPMKGSNYDKAVGDNTNINLYVIKI